jgi:hypothetical protein
MSMEINEINNSEYNCDEVIFLQTGMPMDSIPNETLVNDNEAKLNPTIEIEKYFQRLEPNYLKQLESLNLQIGKTMNPETKVVACIPVAGHQESSNIYRTLESYANQKGNMKELEVLLFINSPEKAIVENKEEIKKTLSEIEKAKVDFESLQVRVAQFFLTQDQVRIGNIRKIGTDLALLRQKESKIETDLILLSNDADNQGISEEYINSYIKYFKENPKKEGAVGNLQFDPNAFIRFPVVQMQQELATFLDQVGFQNGNVMLFGANSCMKSSIYASIGGYPPGLKTGEQNWTGDTIRKLRKTGSTLGFVKDSVLTTSSRRGVVTYVLGLKEQIAFSDNGREDTMRSLDIESSPIFDYADKERLQKLRLELEEVINVGVNAYETGEKLGKDAYYYRNNLEKIGIRYEVIDDIIYITNMDKFIERQELMQGMIKGGEKNMAKVIEESWKV